MSNPPARPPGAVPVDRVRGEHPPTEAGWRHDALAGSRHSRLLDELREPLEDYDPERAEKMCAEIARAALGDLAPALLLLRAERRRRARVLTAFALTLFDFAGQRGLEGDRLAEINRWEFSLEQALDGEPAGQPIFVLMAAEERHRPWPREALDRLVALARRRALGRPPTGGEELGDLGQAFIEALVGRRVEATAGSFAGALLRLAPNRGEESPALEGARTGLLEAVEEGPGPIPADWKKAARFLQLASLNWSKSPGGLGFGTRLALLLRSRFF